MRGYRGDAPDGESEASGEPGASGDRGASLVEYALLLALIAVVCIGALQYFGNESGNSISTSTSRIVDAG